jgi:hypothetical protein
MNACLREAGSLCVLLMIKGSGGLTLLLFLSAQCRPITHGAQLTVSVAIQLVNVSRGWTRNLHFCITDSPSEQETAGLDTCAQKQRRHARATKLPCCLSLGLLDRIGMLSTAVMRFPGYRSGMFRSHVDRMVRRFPSARRKRLLVPHCGTRYMNMTSLMRQRERHQVQASPVFRLLLSSMFTRSSHRPLRETKV